LIFVGAVCFLTTLPLVLPWLVSQDVVSPFLNSLTVFSVGVAAANVACRRKFRLAEGESRGTIWPDGRFYHAAQITEKIMSSMTLDELSSRIKKIDFCMFSTNAGSGRISSRPMSNNGDVEYDGDSWFFSYDDTSKVRQVQAVPDVLLTFSAAPSLLGKPGIFITIEGTATLIRDKASFEEHWVSGLERWFPDGIETPGIVLIKMSAKSIRYWDGEDQGEIPLGNT
jgi:general stress protein 26